MKEVVENYKFAISGGLVGLIIALSFLIAGFFKTVLLLMFIIGGCVIGWYIKKYSVLDKFK